MITLILVRHGETNWNRDGKLAGSSNLATLTTEGIKQAEAVAQKLKEFKIDVIYTSRLRRAIKTAEIIQKTITKKIIFSKLLNERCWGVWEGKSKELEFSKLETMNIRERFNFKPKGGESWKEFEKRLLIAVEKIVSRNEGKTVLIVTHGGVIRALIPALKRAPRDETINLEVRNTSITIFKMNEDKVEEELIADVEHLN